jgi:hypothetical protein
MWNQQKFSATSTSVSFIDICPWVSLLLKWHRWPKMVFEPDTYFESSTVMENIIVETLREFILQNRGKTAGQSGA